MGASNLGDCTAYVMVSALKCKDIFCADLKSKSKLASYDTKCLFHYQSHLWCTVLKSKAFFIFENLGWLNSWNQIWEGKFCICNEIKYFAFQKKNPLLILIFHILRSCNTFLPFISRYKNLLFNCGMQTENGFIYNKHSYPR